MRMLVLSLAVFLAVASCKSKRDERASPSTVVALPTREFYVADILSKRRDDVDRLLGASTTRADGRAQYKVETAAITVLFDNDRAALISISPDHYMPSDDNAAKVLAWVHADRGKLFVDAGTTVDIWSPAMHDRQRARDDAAILYDATARGTELDVAGSCDDVKLHALSSSPATFKRLGFAKLACASGAASVSIR